jgi:hypothetical protein
MPYADSTAHSPNLDVPKLVQVVIKYSGGLVKNEKQASSVLVGLVLVATAVSFFLVLGTMREGNFDPKDYPYGIVGPDET